MSILFKWDRGESITFFKRNGRSLKDISYQKWYDEADVTCCRYATLGIKGFQSFLLYTYRTHNALEMQSRKEHCITQLYVFY